MVFDDLIVPEGASFCTAPSALLQDLLPANQLHVPIFIGHIKVRSGYSAKSIAESWERFGDFPQEIKNLFNSCQFLVDSELLLAIPEFKVKLPGGNRPSQNDLLFISSNTNGLSVCTVEAKAKENFDDRIKDWLNNCSTGKKERLRYILKKIAFPENADYGDLRYQLFHRLASAVIMAEKFHAKIAVMIIQSFVENDKENHFEDFQKFVSAYIRQEVEKENLYSLGKNDGIFLMTGWVYSKA